MKISFEQAIINAGLAPPDIIPDGKLRRFAAPDDKPSNKNCWYVYHGTHGAFGNWATGVTETWHDNTQRDAKGDLELARKIKAAKRRNELQRKKQHQKAASIAQQRWSNGVEVIKHPYLNTKKVHSFGIRQEGENLIIPVRINGEITSIQTITPTGEKRFQKDGEIVGGYHAIGKIADCIYIAEGYSTSASLHMATNQAVACAFNAGNIKHVATALRSQFPEIEIIIAADSDEVGLSKGREAAKAVNAELIYPRFDDNQEGLTDFNDYVNAGGQMWT